MQFCVTNVVRQAEGRLDQFHAMFFMNKQFDLLSFTARQHDTMSYRSKSTTEDGNYNANLIRKKHVCIDANKQNMLFAYPFKVYWETSCFSIHIYMNRSRLLFPGGSYHHSGIGGEPSAAIVLPGVKRR